MEIEIKQLKTKMTEIKFSEWCINGGPINFAAEIQMYQKILETRENQRWKGSLGRKDRLVHILNYNSYT
jgi:hypothetical protein